MGARDRLCQRKNARGRLEASHKTNPENRVYESEIRREKTGREGVKNAEGGRGNGGIRKEGATKIRLGHLRPSNTSGKNDPGTAS